jgi:deazaflavin-dependent oxidoreductase (nitroreductase family)
MMGVVVSVLGIVVAAAVVLGVVFVIGMRRKSPLVLGAVIWLCKVFFNKVQMRTAGTPGAYAGIIRHRGRVSGTVYATPVGVVAVDDGFLIMLVYGSHTHWLRNVMAAGHARLTFEGETYDVDRPELIPLASESTRFSASDQRAARLMDVRDCLRLRRVGVVGAVTAGEAAPAAA